MKIALFNKGIRIGTRRPTRLMREQGLIHERRRRPKGLTKATTEAQEQENLIKQSNRIFSSEIPFTITAYRYHAGSVSRWQTLYFTGTELLRRISPVTINA